MSFSEKIRFSEKIQKKCDRSQLPVNHLILRPSSGSEDFYSSDGAYNLESSVIHKAFKLVFCVVCLGPLGDLDVT